MSDQPFDLEDYRARIAALAEKGNALMSIHAVLDLLNYAVVNLRAQRPAAPKPKISPPELDLGL